MIWTRANGGPVADEDENARRSAKRNKPGGSLKLPGSSQNAEVFLGGSRNDEGICWTAYLHASNQGAWRGKRINKKQARESRLSASAATVCDGGGVTVWHKHTGSPQHAFEERSQSPLLVLPSKVVRSLDQQNK